MDKIVDIVELFLNINQNIDHHIHNIYIHIILEKRLLNFICGIINSENQIVNNVFKIALNNRRSVLGKNFRYLAFKK